MPLPDAIKIWNTSVSQAKEKHMKTGYGFISGNVLRDAQKCYCAMTYIGRGYAAN